MVELRGIGYRAGAVRILDDVTATLRRGRFNVVLGPNGAGKSTLLRVVTGLARPGTGDVLYDGKPVASFGANELARKRAVLSQHVELAFPLPAGEVVMMGRYPHYDRVATVRDHEIVRRALELVEMTDKREQPYPTLSGGEQQKVQLARVIAQIWPYDDRGPDDHRWLFLDEPTSSLDVHYQLHLLEAAVSLLAHDCTVVAILHDLNVAFAYGGHFIVLDHGRVVLEVERAEDIPEELIARVFRVQARRVAEPGEQRPLWRFAL
jgi:iron complex transport system ATP-binding protein